MAYVTSVELIKRNLRNEKSGPVFKLGFNKEEMFICCEKLWDNES